MGGRDSLERAIRWSQRVYAAAVVAICLVDASVVPDPTLQAVAATVCIIVALVPSWSLCSAIVAVLMTPLAWARSSDETLSGSVAGLAVLLMASNVVLHMVYIWRFEDERSDDEASKEKKA
mmetsp:Transcript_26243/g.81816  ORF Transcript_26243/g.81816 Transcript_26243/m.81816 type:complete len:121 (-) Transcript_26243:6-368(-)